VGPHTGRLRWSVQCRSGVKLLVYQGARIGLRGPCTVWGCDDLCSELYSRSVTREEAVLHWRAIKWPIEHAMDSATAGAMVRCEVATAACTLAACAINPALDVTCLQAPHGSVSGAVAFSSTCHILTRIDNGTSAPDPGPIHPHGRADGTLDQVRS